MDKVIILSDDMLFAEGARRKCYFNPDNENECIKIPKNKHGVKDCRREISYLNKVKKRLDPSFNYYSDFLYTVNTNIGLGYVYELIKDQPSGKISQSLDKVYLNSLFFKNGIKTKTLDLKLQKFVDRLQIDKILVADFNARNIVVQFKNEIDFDLKIIDGIGRGNRVPLIDRFGLVSRKKVRKYYTRNLGIIIDTFKDVYQYLENSK